MNFIWYPVVANFWNRNNKRQQYCILITDSLVFFTYIVSWYVSSYPPLSVSSKIHWIYRTVIYKRSLLLSVTFRCNAVPSGLNTFTLEMAVIRSFFYGRSNLNESICSVHTHAYLLLIFQHVSWWCRYTETCSFVICTRVGTLIVATIYLQLIQNRYMFRSFSVLQCSHQQCVQPVASDVEVVGYL